MTSATQTKTSAPWFMELMKTFNSRAEQLQLDEEAADEMRSLFIDKCREQYAVGSKAGAQWMRKKIAEERSGKKETPSTEPAK